jgi:hypothetical protein
MMTNSQLSLAVGLPVLTVLVAVNLVQITGIKNNVGSLRSEMNDLRGQMNSGFSSLRGEMNGLRGEMNSGFSSLRGEMNDLRRDMNSLRSEINTKLDLILAKFYEHDTDIARLKDKTGLS